MSERSLKPSGLDQFRRNREPAHADHECWVPPFTDWVDGKTDTLDFEGRQVPDRLRILLEAAAEFGIIETEVVR